MNQLTALKGRPELAAIFGKKSAKAAFCSSNSA